MISQFQRIRKIAVEFIKNLRHSDQVLIESCEPHENGWFVEGHSKIFHESSSISEYFEIGTIEDFAAIEKMGRKLHLYLVVMTKK